MFFEQKPNKPTKLKTHKQKVVPFSCFSLLLNIFKQFSG